MGEVIYRVLFKISYCTACFDFKDATQAAEFAKLAVTHSINGVKDKNDVTYIGIEVVVEGEDNAEE